MLMNLLPGLRELRAPLVSGYLWLASAWLFFGHMDWLPSKRPPGDGEVARLWDLGGTLGKTVVLAVVTFIAYLIGSFLEIDPDGRIAHYLTPVVLRDRQPWYMKREVRDDLPIEDIMRSLSEKGFSPEEWKAETVARSISSEAKRDLIDALEQRNMLPRRIAREEPHPLRLPGRSETSDQEELRRFDQEELRRFQEWSEKKRTRNQDIITNEWAAEEIIHDILQEMRQLSSRLLVKNQDLYGKYDRQMTEASVRMNVSIPLTVLLVMTTWLSEFRIGLRIALTTIIVAFGFILLRQGFLRAVSARDVIAQALTIGEVESRHMPKTEKATGRDASRANGAP